LALYRTNCECHAVEVGNDLEIDFHAVVSCGDDGAFVLTWKWVSNEEAGIETLNDEGNRKVAEAQLSVAGYRLANLLNEAFK
jgi:secreted PhoX family phosphatase